MKIYIDSEFTQFYGSEFDTKLISIGLVSSDGQECYVELKDHYTVEECSYFVIDSILPMLDLEANRSTAAEACIKIRQFIESFGPDVECKLLCDAPSYDFDLLVELFREAGQPWPYNCSRKYQYLDPGQVDGYIYEYFKNHPTLSKHHALHDARALAYADDIGYRKKVDAAKKTEMAAKNPRISDPFTAYSRLAYDGEISELINEDVKYLISGKNRNIVNLKDYRFIVLENKDMRILSVVGEDDFGQSVLSTNVNWIVKSYDGRLHAKTNEAIYVMNTDDAGVGKTTAQQAILIERAKFIWFNRAKMKIEPMKNLGRELMHRFATIDEIMALQDAFEFSGIKDKDYDYIELQAHDYCFIVIENKDVKKISLLFCHYLNKKNLWGLVQDVTEIDLKNQKVYKFNRGRYQHRFSYNLKNNAYKLNEFTEEQLELINKVKRKILSSENEDVGTFDD